MPLRHGRMVYNLYQLIIWCGSVKIYNGKIWFKPNAPRPDELHHRAVLCGEDVFKWYPSVLLRGTGFIGLLVNCFSVVVELILYGREIIAIVILGPLLAGSLQAAVPNLSTTSQWNSSYNTALPTGAAIWTTKDCKSKTKRILKGVLKSGFKSVPVTIGSVVIQSLAGKRIRKFFGNLLLNLTYCDVKSFSSWHWPYSLVWSKRGSIWARTLYTRDSLVHVDIPDIIRRCHKESELIVNTVPGYGEQPGIHSMT